MSELTIKWDDGYDFTPWVIEKTTRSLDGLSYLVDEFPTIVHSRQYIDALTHLLNVYVYLTGNLKKTDGAELSRIITTYGHDGYLFIEDLLRKKEQSKLIHKIKDAYTFRKIFALIDENENTNRTLINIELDKIIFKNDIYKQIEHDIELVNQGDHDWHWFYQKHKGDKFKSFSDISEYIMQFYIDFS